MVSLNRVILYAQRVERLAGFYRDAFGLAVTEETKGEWAPTVPGEARLMTGACHVLPAVLAVVLAVGAFSALPADAASKKERPGSEPPSLDGRTTGRPRTCGYETFLYSSSGSPVGPYCH
jgi:hypothetical protein